jgi:hypothetical protein
LGVRILRTPAVWLTSLLFLLPSACLAVAPRATVYAGKTVVRAPSQAEAARVSRLFEQFGPRVVDFVPDSELTPIEICMQDDPGLYRFPRSAAHDAEGLWAASHQRILLSRTADSVERTLVHELVHATLGASWRALPGSLEEGLCDYVAAELTSEGAALLRAGRLSSAALVAGGLHLELRIECDDPDLEWSANIVLRGDEVESDAHFDVFRVEAGLSSSTLASGAKRGYYGLSFLLIDRVASELGLDGLQRMCSTALDQGFDHIPRAWLLEAASLDDERSSWRIAAADGIGEAELVELLRMYPSFVVDALVDYIETMVTPTSVDDWFSGRHVYLRLLEGSACIDVAQEDFIRTAVELRLSRPDETAILVEEP